MTIVYCNKPDYSSYSSKLQEKELSYICNNIIDINEEKNIPCIEYYDMVSFHFLGYDYPSSPHFKDIEHQSWEI